MNNDQKQKLEELKRQAQVRSQKQKLQNNVLLQECFEALKDFQVIENDEEIKRLVHLASSPDAEMHSHDDNVVLEDREHYSIVWDEATLPIVICSGKVIKENWDDVMAVAFETYFVAESSGKVIGIKH